MSDLRVTLALCLLGLLAASLAEEMEQVDDAGLKSEARETYQEVMSRQKRHLSDTFCGICHPKWWTSVQLPCKRLKIVCMKWGSRPWAWWRRRRSRRRVCLRWVWYIEMYCCSQGILFYFPFPIPGRYYCFNKYYYGCGGFFKSGLRFPACKYGAREMCGPSYLLSGSQCVKTYKRTTGGAVRVEKNPMQVATNPPATSPPKST